MTILTMLLFLAGIVLLIWGADLLVRGAAHLAAMAGISPLVIGLTVVAMGTSAPELAVSLRAALVGQADLTLGEGYDWFRVSDRSMNFRSGGGGPRFSIGVGGGNWGHSSGVGMGVGTEFGGGGYNSGAPIASVEVFMGRGPKPPGVDVYDARAIRSTLGGPTQG